MKPITILKEGFVITWLFSLLLAAIIMKGSIQDWTDK